MTASAPASRANACVWLLRAGATEATVTVLGLAFKEDVPDIRNSKVVDIVGELLSFGLKVQVHDPVALAEEAADEYGIGLVGRETLRPADAVILAVAHDAFVREGWPLVTGLLKGGAGVVLDV